jgi:hypothetical protein
LQVLGRIYTKVRGATHRVPPLALPLHTRRPFRRQAALVLVGSFGPSQSEPEVEDERHTPDRTNSDLYPL